MTDARRVALSVLRRVFEDGSYAHLALETEAKGLDRRERSLATSLAYGTVQRKATLDWAIDHMTNGELEPEVRAVLRLGMHQLGYMDGIPPHAAVNETVALAPKRARGLVNAVLRRATRELPGLLAGLMDETPAQAALKHSHPEWIAELLWDALGPAGARALMAADNEPAEHAIRRGTEAVVLQGPADVYASPEFAAGEVIPQSRASQLVAPALDPQPGERVLDLCAAPGAKTTHIAALMGDEGEVVAVERNADRADQLRRTCERMRATCVRVEVGDAREPREPESFDRVLVDPPCSGLGTLRSRPDLRWRMTPDRIPALAAEQRAILASAAAALRRGGTLVYSTCTISPQENEDVVANCGLEMEGSPRVTLPHIDGTDGFFIARLRKP